MRNLRSSTILAAVIVSVAAFSADAQRARQNFDRKQDYDVQHYLIKVSFDVPKKAVIGDTTVSLKPLKPGTKSVELDAVDLAVGSVEASPAGVPLKFAASRGKINVELDRIYGPDEVVGLRFKYRATPKKGVYFVDAPARSEDSGRSAQIWTQGEPEEARYWFPAFDFPSDKATTEQVITVADGLTVVGNGELLSKTPNSDGTVTWHYKMPVPHSTYLVSFVIGKYVKIEDKYGNVPLGFYTYQGREPIARTAFGETKAMMAEFEALTKVPYPFNKYDQSLVADFQFGGMENITATTMADTEIFFAETEFGKPFVTDLVSHELAHSWFGNLVTCKNWAELWLNEGFATFMEAVWREKANGRGDYIRKIRTDAASFLVDDMINRRRHGLYNQRAADVNSLFDNPATTYQKGGVVIHMLREQIGNEAFWKGVKIYLDRHRRGSVTTEDLRKAMEEASGQDLEWFFEQWAYGAGAPSLTVRPVYSQRSRTLTLNISQTQALDALTPSAFRLPLEVVVKTSAGEVREKIDLTKRVQAVAIAVPARPTSIDVDPEEKIPLKRLKTRSLAIAR